MDIFHKAGITICYYEDAGQDIVNDSNGKWRNKISFSDSDVQEIIRSIVAGRREEKQL